MKRIKITADIKIPKVPNYFLMSDGQKLPISAVPEKSLRAIGKGWTNNLIERAKEQSKQKG